MTELEMTVEALKRCVPREAFERALHQVRQEAPPVEEKQNPKREEVIQDVLLEVGIPTNFDGFRYAHAAIEFLMDHPGAMITSEVYPEVAKIHGGNWRTVERTIRRAIERAFNRADMFTLIKYFGSAISPTNGKVTNSEFLARMAIAAKRPAEGIKKRLPMVRTSERRKPI